MDRAEAARCLAKVCAYLACGKIELAREWGDKLVDMLREAGVVTPTHRPYHDQTPFGSRGPIDRPIHTS
jgi:hypothetical protein